MLFAILPVEESQPNPVGRTPRRRGRRQPRTAHQRLRSAVLGAVGGVGNARGTGISGRLDPSIVYPKAYPERPTETSREVMISYKSFIIFIFL
jgi:hypothetical protein